jgi:DNA-binding Lrp family transcriptional regulator
MKARSENPKDEGPFAWQTREAAVEAGKLGINAYAIYCALTHFQSAAATEHKRRFSASYEQLAEHVGCSRGTVKTALDALEKAGLIRKFSGSNGAHRATRNAFFLTSISSPPHGRGSTPGERHVSTPHGRHVSTQFGRFREKENSYSAPPQAAAGVTEKEETESACSRLGRGSDSKKQHADISHLPEDRQKFLRTAWAQAEETDRIIAEQKAAQIAENFD